ncbi:unnamed protein product [Boreogadus saida]
MKEAPIRGLHRATQDPRQRPQRSNTTQEELEETSRPHTGVHYNRFSISVSSPAPTALK